MCKQEKSLEFIENSRKCRETGIEWLHESVEYLDRAIFAMVSYFLIELSYAVLESKIGTYSKFDLTMQGDLESKNNDDYGAACHVRAKALCLRALCNNERKLQNWEVLLLHVCFLLKDFSS